jgi:hypothetical protein
MQKSSFGSFAFALGFLICIFFGIIGQISNTIAWFLIGFGIVIGILNWLWNDPRPFLMASFAIVVIAQFGPNALINANTMLVILDRMTILYVPVVLLNALKLVFDKMHLEKTHK